MYIYINYTLYPWKQQVQVPPGAQVTGAYEFVLGTEPAFCCGLPSTSRPIYPLRKLGCDKRLSHLGSAQGGLCQD